MPLPPKRIVPPQPAQTSPAKFSLAPIATSKRGHRIVLYGTGGIGKSTLACLLDGSSAFIDADESLGILKSQLIESDIQIPKVVPGVTDWSTLRGALQSDCFDAMDNIIIDTGTKVEEWAVAHTIKTVKHEKPSVTIGSIEDYGFGKGFQHVFETFMHLLGDLDRHVRAGRNVIIVCHDCTCNVPNPGGTDWLRYEPRLQSPSSGKASIRLRMKEWADHVLFLGYDVAVGKDKKAEGSGTRTLYSSELPFCMAKSRTTNEQFNIEHGVSPWGEIIK